jgi:hypothetical protein
VSGRFALLAGVEHVAGDMFDSIPSADIIFFKVKCCFPHTPLLRPNSSRCIQRIDSLLNQRQKKPEFPAVSSTSSSSCFLSQHVLHGWDDESCIKILRNCRKALPEEGGMLVIMDAIMEEDDDIDMKHPFGEIRMVYDLFMMVIRGTKDRTVREWENLLRSGGFPRLNIINIPYRDYIIEAFPA